MPDSLELPSFDPEQMAVAEGIEIVYWDWDDILGMYARPRGGPPIIGLRADLRRPSSARRVVLSHELGHHFLSGPGDYVTSAFRCPASYAEALQLSKVEIAAHRWAMERLAPAAYLRDAISRAEVWDEHAEWAMAIALDVTPDALRWWLGLLSDIENLGGSRRPPKCARIGEPLR